VTLTLTPQNGFNSTVSLACVGGLPAGASCSFSPAAVKVGSATTATMTITTSTQSAGLGRDVSPIFPGGVVAVALCIFGWRRRRTAWLLLLLVGLSTGLGLVSGCGSSRKALVYDVTVNGTSGSVQQSILVSLTLK
jgi:hypothetical protein